MSTDITVWVGAILTFAAYSFLVFGDNPAYDLAEHLFIGCASGYAFSLAVTNLKTLAFTPLLAGDWVVIIPTLLGVMLYFKFIPKASWVSRIPVSLIVALASGVAARGAVESQILSQIKATMLPLNNVTNIILVLGVISVTWYFFLSFKSSSATTKGLSTIGKWVMMAAFGASFANIVTARFSILIGRFQFLVNTWLGLS
jgi:hypothetical protein